MANLRIKDSTLADKYLKGTGAGTDVDPFVPVHDVVIQDQISPVLIVPFHKEIASTTLDSGATENTKNIVVVSAASFVIGQYLTIYNVAGNRFFQGNISNIAGTTITLDTPLDFSYQAGDKVSVSITNLNVDGSSATQIFTLRAPESGLTISGDITRLIFIMETTTVPDWGKFGDVTELVNGIVIRKKNGSYENILNVKTNADLAAVMYDLEFIEAARFGINGVKGRLTFAGQEKIGVAVRIEPDEDLELLIQDDLTGLISFKIIAEGHIVV